MMKKQKIRIIISQKETEVKSKNINFALKVLIKLNSIIVKKQNYIKINKQNKINRISLNSKFKY